MYLFHHFLKLYYFELKIQYIYLFLHQSSLQNLLLYYYYCLSLLRSSVNFNKKKQLINYIIKILL